MTSAVADRLDIEALTTAAMQQAGVDDFGPIPFDEPLRVLVDALAREAKLDESRCEQARGTLVGLLVKRLHLVRDRHEHPEIDAEKVVAPLVIVGLPRTGSTHLHALLGQDQALRVPLFWEQSIPSPPPDRATYAHDARIAIVNKAIEAMPAELMKRHPVAADRPEQCNMLLDWSFRNLALLAYYEIPSYRDWLLATTQTPAYEAHRWTLQQLQWRVPGRWVLKYPKHMLALDTLLATYPDAKLIWTHRDPVTVVPSAASLTGFLRSPTPGFDPKRFGREWAVLEELVLRRGLSTRDRLPDPSRDYDVHYGDLMRDPIGTIDGIYTHFGMSLGAQAQDRMQAWVDGHPQTQHGVHRYSAEEFGLDPAELRERFAFYSERFGADESR
jgi:hypothetical protein